MSIYTRFQKLESDQMRQCMPVMDLASTGICSLNWNLKVLYYSKKIKRVKKNFPSGSHVSDKHVQNIHIITSLSPPQPEPPLPGAKEWEKGKKKKKGTQF